MKTVVVSAPGKIHLMGEHAVVYGKPALLSAINLRMRVTITSGTKKKPLEIISTEPTDYVKHIIELVQKHFGINSLPPMYIRVESKIPAGYHLGSSSAVAVAIVGALTYFLKGLWNPQSINQLAYEAEKYKHGNPSGGDNTIATMGGFLWFRKELDFLKSIWQLPYKLPQNFNHFYLLDTGRPKETTKEMISLVSAKFKINESVYTKLFDENEIQTKRIAVSLKEGNEKELMNAMYIGERTLEQIGVVSDKAQSAIRSIEKLGGSAKILGGGGKTDSVGFILCYIPDSSKVSKTLLPIELGAEGIKLEKKGLL